MVLHANVASDDRLEQAFAPRQRARWSFPTADVVPWGVGVVVSLYLLLWVSGAGSNDTRTAITGVVGVALNVLAMVASWRVRRDWAVAPQARQAWGRITVAFGAALVGTVATVVEHLVDGGVGRPAVADLGFLAFYPLAVWALLSFVGTHQATQRVTLWFDFLIVAVSGAMAVWYLVFDPLTDGPLDGSALALSLVYPVADLVLLFGLVVLLQRRPDDVAIRSLQLLAAAASLLVVADLGYSVRLLDGEGETAGWFHVAVIVAWALAAAAAETQRRQSERRAFDAYDVAEPSPLVSNLPHVAGAAAVVLVAVVAVHRGVTGDGGIILGAAVLTAVAQARQWLAVRQANALLEQYRDVLRTDRLTGLPNRHRFLQEGEETVVMTQLCGLPLGLVVLDIDGLRHLNAELGEAAGDAVIKEVATRCRMALRGRDVVARYGGDEIVALLPGTDAAGTELVASRLRAELAAPVVAGGRSLDVVVSVGTAAVGLEATSIGELLIAADADLERVKGARR